MVELGKQLIFLEKLNQLPCSILLKYQTMIKWFEIAQWSPQELIPTKTIKILIAPDQPRPCYILYTPGC